MGISASAMGNNVETLKELGLLVIEGSDNSGNWRINYILLQGG